MSYVAVGSRIAQFDFDIMEPWEVKENILNPVRKADLEISTAYLKWFPDHPAADIDPFWEDPFPEQELAYNEVERYLKFGFGFNVIATLSTTIRRALQEGVL